MNLLKRKMPLFCISNIMVSFVCTGFLGTNYYNASVESSQSDGETVALDAFTQHLWEAGFKDVTTVKYGERYDLT